MSGLGSLHGAAGKHEDAQAWRAADCLLACGEDDVDIPAVEGDLFTTHAADAVDDDEGFGADFSDDFGDGFDITQHTGGCIDVGDGQDLVFVLCEGVLDLVKRGSIANGGLELRSIDAVGLQTC